MRSKCFGKEWPPWPMLTAVSRKVVLLVSAFIEVFRFPVMQSTFCFPNRAIITIPAASLINYFRPKGEVESVFIGEKRLNSASVSENSHSSAIADHMTQTGHRIKWDHFDILATGQSDMHCKIKETLLIGDLKPALNKNVGSEKLLLY